MAFLSIRNLSVGYGKTEVLRRFSLEVERGSICCLIGPSGCGKSTLLKTICGILHPQSGEIVLENNRALVPARPLIGYIPQHFGLLDWLTVKENLFLGKRIRHLPPSPDDEQIVHRLELTPLLHRYPGQLSGGQQQRVALARAWMLQPELLLMDEPFSSLDTHTAERSLDLFLQLWETRKPTTLFVTHNLREAMRVGPSIVTLSEPPAEVPEVFSKQDFHRPC